MIGPFCLVNDLYGPILVHSVQFRGKLRNVGNNLPNSHIQKREKRKRLALRQPLS
jgi:hypothetical protein